MLSGQTRGAETSRIEAFSDGVFAFALTLLVVSLEVPRSFADLVETMRGFPAFGACFAILVWIWVEHYRFFRQYRISDGVTILLNSLLLFVVLFYIYPLKFMFTFLAGIFFGVGPASGGAAPMGMTVHDAATLLLIYGVGFVAVFLVFALLHWRVYAVSARLGLSPAERQRARVGLRTHLLSVGVGLVSIALVLALPVHLVGLAGFVYASLGPVHAINGWRSRRLFDEPHS